MSANPSMMKNPVVHESTAGSGAGRASGSSVSQRPILKTKTGAKPAIEYRLTYLLVFMLCLAITGVRRCWPFQRSTLARAGARISLWSEARSAADSTVPYVFQQ